MQVRLLLQADIEDQGEPSTASTVMMRIEFWDIVSREQGELTTKEKDLESVLFLRNIRIVRTDCSCMTIVSRGLFPCK